jgi:methyltransferase family protein
MQAYAKLSTLFYDLDKPAAPRESLEFYLRRAGEALGPILEPMCGSGRFLIPLLERGMDVEGVDESSFMLQACRDRCEARGLSPALHEQSLDALDLPRRYGLVMIPEGSFCLLTDPARARACLTRLHAMMLSGGRLVFEVEQLLPLTLSRFEPSGRRSVNLPEGGELILSWSGRYSPTERVSRSENRYQVLKDGLVVETEIEKFDLRYYEPAEVAELLERSGFRDVQMTKPFGSAPPAETDESFVVECVRDAD